MTTKQVLESATITKPVRQTPLKRFDSKEAMERDLERYRAEARARLLRNGFDIPPFLMPKPKISEDDEDEDRVIDPDAGRDVRSPVMIGPKPTPLLSSSNLADAKKEREEGDAGGKPNRHVHVQNKASGFSHMLTGGQAPSAAAKAAENAGAAQYSQVRADAQAAAIAKEKTAYDEYVQSLNGGRTLLDGMRDNGDAPANDIKGRVDDLKEAEARQSRIDLPENTSNWAARDEIDAKRKAMLRKQEQAQAKKERSSRNSREKLSWNKILPKLAAYMIAAVAIGYVLVLTVNEFAVIINN